MAVLRSEKKSNYTVIDNAIFKDYSLSMKAKGLLCQMLSLPDGWDYSIAGLTTLVNDGESAVRSALKELEQAGYFRREQVRENGKIVGIEYIISETKNCDFPLVENPQQGFPQQGNQGQLNTNKSNTNKLKTDTDIGERPTRKKNANLHSTPSLRPSLEEIEAYISEKGLIVDSKRFFDYFDASDWVDSKGNPVRNWKQKLITWSKNNDNRGSYGIRTGIRSTEGKGDRSVGNGEKPEWCKLPRSAPTLSEDDRS